MSAVAPRLECDRVREWASLQLDGELSVLDRMPRNATVATEMPTTCLALASWDFDAVLLDQPALTLAILRGVAARLREVTESVRQ